MGKVRPKKHLGQHFLVNKRVAEKIVNAVSHHGKYPLLIEIGPGTGILTGYLLKDDRFQLKALDIDQESLDYLRENYSDYNDCFELQDFLSYDVAKLKKQVGIIGNFPYNISSQIFFHILRYENQVEEVVCMLQKEVAERITAGPGSKIYGILSVLIQAYYDAEYLFNVKPANFNPPPRVMSGVIRLKRNNKRVLECDKALFFRMVKTAFQKRRKTLRNALKPINLPPLEGYEEILSKRAEQLSVQQFINLTREVEQEWKK